MGEWCVRLVGRLMLVGQQGRAVPRYFLKSLYRQSRQRSIASIWHRRSGTEGERARKPDFGMQVIGAWSCPGVLLSPRNRHLARRVWQRPRDLQTVKLLRVGR